MVGRDQGVGPKKLEKPIVDAGPPPPTHLPAPGLLPSKPALRLTGEVPGMTPLRGDDSQRKR